MCTVPLQLMIFILLLECFLSSFFSQEHTVRLNSQEWNVCAQSFFLLSAKHCPTMWPQVKDPVATRTHFLVFLVTCAPSYTLPLPQERNERRKKSPWAQSMSISLWTSVLNLFCYPKKVHFFSCRFMARPFVLGYYFMRSPVHFLQKCL